MKNITYSEAIELVMQENGGFSNLRYIYDNIEKYRKKTGKTPDNTIQEKVQRDSRFTRIGKGIYALSSFIEEVEKNSLGFFTYDKQKNLIFKQTKDKAVEIKIPEKTEKAVLQKARIGQNIFRKALLGEMKACPITGIDDPRLLIASHIKPWLFSNDEERLNNKNGILLSPLFDKLFDKSIGLITFTSKHEILISSKLSDSNRAKLGITNGQVFENLDIKGRKEFLNFHNEFIFQD